jgi:hypothetical protein
MKRRDFIKTAGGVALISVTQTIPAVSALRELSGTAFRKPRVAVFYEPTFPPGEISSLTKEQLQESFVGWDVVYLAAHEVQSLLTIHNHDVFVNPHGSCFPKEAWSAISQFLSDGGNWVNLGGVPFSVPVVREGEKWRKEVSTTAYHKKFNITQAFPVSTKDISSYSASMEFHGTQELLQEFSAEEVYELYVRFTSVKDFPAEDGTGGPRDAVLHPLVVGISGERHKLVAPFIEIDRFQGACAGGRWVLVNFKGTITPKAVRTLSERALQGSMELVARPSFACYHEGEMPSFTIQLRSPGGEVEKLLASECTLSVHDDRGKLVGDLRVQLHGSETLAIGYVDMISQRNTSLPPGLYHVNVTMNVRSVSSPSSYKLQYSTGFWVFDKQLIAGGTPLTVDEDYFWRDGKPYPVTGTTYMASDVHRKFLFEPNPHIWNEDFNSMKHAGVNMVRTGIWTGWKNFMLDVGAPNETALRAMDAFVLTARKHDIPLVFTFFAFLPESWGGANSYLDPRSVNAQKEFIAMFVQRYRPVNDIIWDLINEPSFCSPAHLWECRPNYDMFEVNAWNAWLKERYPSTSDGERASQLREYYRASADEPISLPALSDFDDVNIFNEQRPVKVIDYRLFAQEMFGRWVTEMTKTIRGNGNTHQLITVGQDEGGTNESPGNQFFNKNVDFTCLHNWWLNDDLLWDNVITKAPGKANLVEESGVMFYEKMDATPWRSEEYVRNLLERKLAFSLGAGAAGFIQWIWNTNCYMTLDNEAAIGFHRVDGTRKPELQPFIATAKFIADNRHLMKGRIHEEVTMVVPHSQMFSTRNFSTEATKRCVRAMSYYCHMPMSAVSEYRIGSLKSIPKLIVVPSPRILSEQAWQEIIKLTQKGSTLLISGTFDADEHWLPVSRSKQFISGAVSKPVTQEEFMSLEGKTYQLSFRGDKLQRIEKAIVDAESILESSVGASNGKMIWSLLPIELAENIEPTVVLYTYALKKANISPVYSTDKKDSSVLIISALFEESVLYTCISESDRETNIQLQHHETATSISLTVPAQRTVMMFVSRKDGKIISRMD